MFNKIFSLYKKLPGWARIVLIIAVIGGGFFGYRQVFGKENGYKQVQVEEGLLVESLELSGDIQAYRQANLHFAAGGLVTYLPFKEGDRVTKWQTIASLDQRQLQKDLQKYLNLYSQTRNDFDTTVEDDDNNLALDQNDQIKRLLADNQYTLNNAVIDVESRDLAIKLSRLYAPFDGIITRMDITTANVNVLPTDIFQIVDPSSLYFSANLDEEDLVRVTEGQKAIVTLDAFPDLEFETVVESIAFAAKETSTGTAYEIKFNLPAEVLDKLRLGLNGTVTIKLEEKENALSVPFEAIDEKDDGTFVTVLENGQIVDRKIETGIQTDSRTEVTSGLNKNDTVVIRQ